jgi:hypothetical protein
MDDTLFIVHTIQEAEKVLEIARQASAASGLVMNENTHNAADRLV